MTVLEFPSTSGFKKYEEHFSKASIAHPAKANLLLLDWIVSTYTKEGDVVLDPMAGTGSTGIVASILGRNAVLVELEERFIGFINANLEKSQRQTVLGQRGWVRVIHGDASNLSSLLGLGGVDVVVTSPPYSEILGKGHRSKLGDLKKQGSSYQGFADVVVTSPPYANRLADAAVHDGDEARMSYRQSIDCVVTSPPYSGTISKQGGEIESNPLLHNSLKKMRNYSESEQNIGNLRQTSYLEAMRQVYAEIRKVLKPEDKMILILKNFIRAKKVVHLDLDTIKLCESVGFHLQERHKFKLPSESFWRVIYRKKYPDVEAITHEDILVFSRSSSSSSTTTTTTTTTLIDR